MKIPTMAGEGDDKLYGDQESDASEEAFGYDDKLYGGKDSLYGGSGNNVLDGADNDKLDGGEGRDTLKGVAGFDRYFADRQNTITDTDGHGSVSLAEQRLSLATRKKRRSHLQRRCTQQRQPDRLSPDRRFKNHRLCQWRHRHRTARKRHRQDQTKNQDRRNQTLPHRS